MFITRFLYSKRILSNLRDDSLVGLLVSFLNSRVSVCMPFE